MEFASGGRKALSRNPYNPAHTPGGSSSGSGAAVGDFHVPFAFGTQTGGSHIRPAAFNGIYAIKPTWGIVSREGVRMSSMTLDTVGWYARCVDDLIMVADAFRLPKPAAPFATGPKGLRVGLCRSPVWSAIEPAGEASLLLAAKRLADAGAIVEEYELARRRSTGCMRPMPTSCRPRAARPSCRSICRPTPSWRPTCAARWRTRAG